MKYKRLMLVVKIVKKFLAIVLATIIVPSMLGYVKKSKVSSANSAANSLQKAINTALVKVNEEANIARSISSK